MFQQNSTIPGFIQITISILVISLLAMSLYYLIYIGNKYVATERRININWKNIFKLILIAIGISLIVALFRAFPVLGTTLSAVLIAILLAYLLNPLVNKLEKLGLSRQLGTVLIYLFLILFFVGLGFLVIPSLFDQIRKFISNLPEMTNYVLNWVEDLLKKNHLYDTEIYYQAESSIKDYITKSSSKILDWSGGIVTSLTASLGFLLTLVLIPIITFFLLTDKKMIFEKIKSTFPKKYYNDARALYYEIDESMSNFVRGRILMAVFVGVVTMIVLLLMNVEFAVVIGLITMISDIIPYVGPFVGFLPAGIFSLMHSPLKFFWVGVLFFFVNWVENNILGPKLLGESTGIHPLIILISIIIGGGMFGVWGMILSVPFVSLVIILSRFFVKKMNE